MSTSFAVPSEVVGRAGLTGELIVRSELAYIKDEPIASQSQLDPFYYLLEAPQPVQTGGTLKADSINWVLGLDTNQFIMLDVITSGALKGNSGVSLLRDRDNLLFQFEYVI